MNKRDRYKVKNSILDKKIKTADDLEDVLGLRLISVIPNTKEKGGKRKK